MARLPYVEYENASEELRAIYDQVKGSRPSPINIQKMVCNSVEAFKRFRAYNVYLNQETGLERKLVELVILTVGKVTTTPYVWAQHISPAFAAGATQEEISRIGGSLGTFDPRYRAALQYAAEVAGAGQVEDVTFAELRRFFSPKQIIDLTLLACQYLATTRLAVALQLDLEPEHQAQAGL